MLWLACNEAKDPQKNLNSLQERKKYIIWALKKKKITPRGNRDSEESHKHLDSPKCTCSVWLLGAPSLLHHFRLSFVYLTIVSKKTDQSIEKFFSGAWQSKSLCISNDTCHRNKACQNTGYTWSCFQAWE